jgi:hypothetical protein
MSIPKTVRECWTALGRKDDEIAKLRATLERIERIADGGPIMWLKRLVRAALANEQEGK